MVGVTGAIDHTLAGAALGEAIAAHLGARARAADRMPEELLTQHVMEGFLRRLATLDARTFALRGGLLTSALVRPAVRLADDVDLISPHPFDEAQGRQIIQETLRATPAQDDAVRLDADACAFEVIWGDTSTPGLRATVPAHIEGAGFSKALQIDVGFGDPLIPPAHLMDYPTLLPELGLARVLATRVETLIGWKLHGLIEFNRWRGKDMMDLRWLTQHASPDPELLLLGIRSAFDSRDHDLRALSRLRSGDFGTSRGSRRAWLKYAASHPASQIPDSPTPVVEAVRAALDDVLEALGVPAR